MRKIYVTIDTKSLFSSFILIFLKLVSYFKLMCGSNMKLGFRRILLNGKYSTENFTISIRINYLSRLNKLAIIGVQDIIKTYKYIIHFMDQPYSNRQVQRYSIRAMSSVHYQNSNNLRKPKQKIVLSSCRYNLWEN